MVASAGWYIAAVDLWPASSRPYIGGSTSNSLLEPALGYNGIGRLLGGTGNGGGSGGATSGSGSNGDGGAVGGSISVSAIATWVAAHYTATTVGGSTVYDPTQTAR